jgi:hypothetical protein
MTYWLERSESRFLDLISSSIFGLVEENKNKKFPDKYEFFIKGSQSSKLFNNIHPVILKSQVESFSKISQGRYIREMSYVLVALDLCDDLFAEKISQIKIKKISDFDYNDFTEFIQSKKSKYLANKDGIELSKLEFGSEKWADILGKKILSYGYFCRYLDIIELLTTINKKYLDTNMLEITQLKNLIGPFDHRVKGSGPDFIQETFKSWAFLLDIIKLKTGGRLESYSKKDKLEYLKKHSGYISDGNKAYEILRNLKKTEFIINKQINEPIRVMSFIKLVNLETWRHDFHLALYLSLRRMRMLFLLNSKFNSFVEVNSILNDQKIIHINDYFKNNFNILEDLIYLECMGYKINVQENKTTYSSVTEYILEKIISKKTSSVLDSFKNIGSYSNFKIESDAIMNKIDVKKLKIKAIRKFNIDIFNKYCPQGEFIQWIQKN